MRLAILLLGAVKPSGTVITMVSPSVHTPANVSCRWRSTDVPTVAEEKDRSIVLSPFIPGLLTKTGAKSYKTDRNSTKKHKRGSEWKNALRESIAVHE